MTLRDEPWPIGDGRFTVPANRWDLLDHRVPAQPPTVSVVIPYFDGQSRLDRMLAALALQTHPLTRLQVVVADDGSPTAPVIRAPSELNVQVVGQDDLGFRAAAARNLGAAATDGAVLCFLDDDTVPEPAYVAELARLPALAPDALAVGRRRHTDLARFTPADVVRWLRDGVGAPPEDPPPQWLIDAYRETGNLARIDEESHRYVISAVMACHRDLFGELGGFDPGFTHYGGEDWEFAHRALCAGAVLAHVPTAVAWHDGPSWAERADPRARRLQKNDETATLLRLIPPSRGRAPVWSDRPDVVVELDVDDVSPAAVIVGVHCVLAADVDAGVWLRGRSAAALVATHFAADTRVAAGPVPAAATASARRHVRCSRPVRVPAPTWPALLALVGPTAAGQVVIDAGSHAVIITSATARRRSARWTTAGGPDLLDELFGRIVVEADAVGVSALDDPPDLAHELKHLRRR